MFNALKNLGLKFDLWIMLVLIPISVLPIFGDQYTTAKWSILYFYFFIKIAFFNEEIALIKDRKFVSSIILFSTAILLTTLLNYNDLKIPTYFGLWAVQTVAILQYCNQLIYSNVEIHSLNSTFGNKTMTLIVLAIGCAIVIKNISLPKADISRLEVGKQSSLVIRKSLATSALQMITNSFQGYGSAQFEFNSVPFQKYNGGTNSELVIYKSPHNEFLKTAVKYGVIGVIAAWLLCRL